MAITATDDLALASILDDISMPAEFYDYDMQSKEEWSVRKFSNAVRNNIALDPDTGHVRRGRNGAFRILVTLIRLHECTTTPYARQDENSDDHWTFTERDTRSILKAAEHLQGQLKTSMQQLIDTHQEAGDMPLWRQVWETQQVVWTNMETEEPVSWDWTEQVIIEDDEEEGEEEEVEEEEEEEVEIKPNVDTSAEGAHDQDATGAKPNEKATEVPTMQTG